MRRRSARRSFQRVVSGPESQIQPQIAELVQPLFRAPGPHPTRIVQAIATEPLNARGRPPVGGLARKKLQADRADFERFRMPVRKSSKASVEVAADGALWIVIVITLVGRHSPIKRLL